jgi:hypothetical protein
VPFWLFVADVMAGLQTGDVPMPRRVYPAVLFLRIGNTARAVQRLSKPCAARTSGHTPELQMDFRRQLAKRLTTHSVGNTAVILAGRFPKPTHYSLFPDHCPY